jgi:hypothetical protein
MNKQIGDELRNQVQSLYAEDKGAMAFFNWAAARTNDVSETSVDRIAQVSELTYPEARELAKAICEIGCGELVFGRKGRKSRIRWHRSLKSLGLAASGQSVEIEDVDPVLLEDAKDQAEGGPLTINSGNEGLTITEAKRRLAESLGVTPEAIEITIRG